jgi:membrane-associated protein
MLHEVLQLVTHTKDTLQGWSGEPWFAWALFAILFAETGLVVTPFLPGDSLLFAVGAVLQGGRSSAGMPELLALMCIAAVLGDAVNYSIGKWAGPAVFKSGTSRLLNKSHLLKAQAFYEKYGAKTIVLARFVPVVRTFAPFVAGIGRMSYARFALYNVVGGVAWVVSLTMAGYCFSGWKPVADHFELVVLMIVFISILPIVVEFVKARRGART